MDGSRLVALVTANAGAGQTQLGVLLLEEWGSLESGSSAVAIEESGALTGVEAASGASSVEI